MRTMTSTITRASLLLLSLAVIAGFSYAEPIPASKQAQQLITSLGLREGAQPIDQQSGWRQPDYIVAILPAAFKPLTPVLLAALTPVAGDIPIKVYQPDGKPLPDYVRQAEVVIGNCSKDLLDQLPKLQWLQHLASGVESCTSIAGVQRDDFTLTNIQRLAAPEIAEHAIALSLMLTRNLHLYYLNQRDNNWQRRIGEGFGVDQLNGKTMLVLGLGGIGLETAKRAHALGMRVIATRNSSRNGPAYVDYVGLSDEMYELAGQADIIVNALPLTPATEKVFNDKFFAAAKTGSRFISVGRGKSLDLDALMAAINSGHIKGAALDVTDPEPLPKEHPIWQMEQVIITPHVAGYSKAGIQRSFILYQENLRRYLNGERMLNVVSIKKGY